METFEKISAYTKIVETFVGACKDNKTDPLEAWLAIGRFMDFTSRLAPQAQPPTSTPKKKELSSEEKKKAKAEAKKAKAKRLGLSISEVNLTGVEIQAAISGAMRREENSPPSPSSQDLVNKVPEKKAPSESKARKPANIPKDVSGSRATAKTRLDTARSTALRSLPCRGDPKLKILAYVNDYNRLVSQWLTFKENFEEGSMLNPIRGLPDPFESELVKEFFQETANSGVRMSDIGLKKGPIFVLQDVHGGSYWDQGKPSSHCPKPLQEEIPDKLAGVFDNSN